jgi:hypothetical protein
MAQPEPQLVTYELLMAADEDVASTAVAECFRSDKAFQRVAQAEIESIMQADKEVCSQSPLNHA